MEEKVIKLTYASSLTEICNINSSFDKGVLRVCYTGENRNHTSISKETIMGALKTIYNCPLVCHYDRDTDSLGGHDVELVKNSNGDVKIVNMTTPVGVIPESAKVWFDYVTEADGTSHEYLYTEVLLWKRQEAYEKIKRDGITAHSMEITVKKGEDVGGVYRIDDFEFTAFALIGVTPCFESSALEVYSMDDFDKQMNAMLLEYKSSFSLNNSSTSDGVENIENSAKGGNILLDEKQKLAETYGIDISTLDFSIDDLTIEQLKVKFEEIKKANERPKYELASNMLDELDRTLSEEKISTDWGEYSRYIFVDCDFESGEVYCWDRNDWILYGFNYSADGDSVKIDFASKKRKKFAIIDFDGGDQSSPIADVFTEMSNKLSEYAGFEKKYEEASKKITDMEAEINDLKQYKLNIENEAAKGERVAVLNKFEDLNGIEAFEELRNNCMDFEIDALEEKCFAIRGRNVKTLKFSSEKPEEIVKLKVPKPETDNEPYGGLFLKYGKATK